MTLTQNALVLHTTHQPAKPVETINTSHVFAAETIKTKLLNKNSPLNVEAAKNKANVKTKFIWFWLMVIQNNMSVHLQVVSELGCKIF